MPAIDPTHPHDAPTDPTPTVRLLSDDGALEPNAAGEPYADRLDDLGEDELRRFYRDMAVIRRFDLEAGNLQRQGQLALWVPSRGQEGAQVGSAHALRPQDHAFPSYREHVVAMIRGVDVVDILRMLRGTTHGGWDPASCGNFHLYTLVLASQNLHATGYAMGLRFDGVVGTGDPDTDAAVISYYGDGASSQGDTSEALVFASSYQTPQVFFLQNNHWAISVPVERQSRVPLARRGPGFGMPGVRLDGNDVLASYAVSVTHLDAARSGGGPALLEALTYRLGAHTTADDPTRYRPAEEEQEWTGRDPIVRFRRHLERLDAPGSLFEEVDAEAEEFAQDARRRILATEPPSPPHIFEHVYAEPHAPLDEQAAWLQRYEQSFLEERA